MAQRAADQVTITDVTDAYTVSLSNETHAFPGTTTNAIAGSTTTVVTAYWGAIAQTVAATKAAIEATAPAGITVTVTNSGTTAMTIQVNIANTVTTAGKLSIPITIGTAPNQIVITKEFTYSIAFTGAAGVETTYVDMQMDSVVLPVAANGSLGSSVTINIPFIAFKGTARQSSTAATLTSGGVTSKITLGTVTQTTASVTGLLPVTFAAGDLGGTNSGTLVFSITVNSIAYTRSFSWAKAVTGAGGSPGVSATSIDVGNEAFTINVDDLHRAKGAQTINIPFTGWIGSTRQAIAKAAVSVTGPSAGAMPAGIVYSNAAITDATSGAAGNIPLTIADAALVATTGTLAGTIEVNITVNSVAFKQILSWSKIIENPSISLEITSDNGTTFKNSNGNTTLKANIFRNGTLLTYAQATGSGAGQWNYGVVKWYKDGVYQSVKDGETFLVNASDISSKAVYSAQLEY